MRDGRSQIADQRGPCAALGDHPLGRIIRGIQVEIRQIANKPVRPALARHARLLAGHKLQRAMGAEMQHSVGAEILGDPAIERAESMGRSEAAFEQQAHRIAFVSECRLDSDEDIPETLA